ncbi:MAG: J domain-containing protein [Cellulomonadaceae bacterium]|jgi:hypothetical protein|nr:J domain-containing protein [Cellulomonadaceae bacterium]
MTATATIKDHYLTLGVPKDADITEIKRVYRQLSRTCHPDMPGGSEARMKEITEAYAELSDPAKRADHDTQLRYGTTERGPIIVDDYTDEQVNDIIDEFEDEWGTETLLDDDIIEEAIIDDEPPPAPPHQPSLAEQHQQHYDQALANAKAEFCRRRRIGVETIPLCVFLSALVMYFAAGFGEWLMLAVPVGIFVTVPFIALSWLMIRRRYLKGLKKPPRTSN